MARPSASCGPAGADDWDSGLTRLDMQLSYLETAPGFIGFENIRWALVLGTPAPTEDKDRSVAATKVQTRRTARTF